LTVSSGTMAANGAPMTKHDVFDCLVKQLWHFINVSTYLLTYLSISVLNLIVIFQVNLG